MNPHRIAMTSHVVGTLTQHIQVVLNRRLQGVQKIPRRTPHRGEPLLTRITLDLAAGVADLHSYITPSGGRFDVLVTSQVFTETNHRPHFRYGIAVFKEGLCGLKKVVRWHFSAKKSLWSQSKAFVRIPSRCRPR